VNALNVVDSSSDDDSSILEDDSSRLSSAVPRPLVPGGSSQQLRAGAEFHGSRSGSDGRVSHSSGATRGATPPSGASRDVDATPPASRPSCACSAYSLYLIFFLHSYNRIELSSAQY